MRRVHAVLLALVLLVAFVAGAFVAPTPSASAGEPVCWYSLCEGQLIICCEGQVCCPGCFGDPPVCQ